MDTWAVFTKILGKRSASPLFHVIDFVREMDISWAMTLCQLQDPLRFRARFIALEIANVLIDEAGNLQLDIARELHEQFEIHRFILGPSLENDAFIFQHIRSSLRSLLQTSALQKLLQKFSIPLCHEGAARLIRDTLWPKPIKQIHEADVKRAAVAAWFTWLRQTTGSCFATAPAILIQQNQPLQLLQDLFDLLTFGSLRRIISGQEYSVPLCPSIEQFDLTRPLTGFRADLLSIAPGLRAAIGAAGFSLAREQLQSFIEQTEDAKTPKELIESILLRLHQIQREDVLDEEGLKSLEMNPLLAKQSAIYYQKPSERAAKVSQWKKAVAKALAAYQALGDCALLRAWEATVASFSDVKLDVAKWNLTVSLGLHPDFPGGIGAFAYNLINAKLATFNQQITDLQVEYEHLSQIAYNAEKRGLRGDVSHAMVRANSIRQQIEECARDGERLSKLFPVLIEGLDKLIPESFQEIFDPSLAQNLAEMIDDSPAGFRLAHKHGRRASSQWTFIRSAEEFVHALREFFEYAERELMAERPADKIWIEQILTALIQFIQTEEFLGQAIQRTRNNPSVQDPGAKPWQYISGGTMPALLMAYTNRQSPFSALKKTIHNEQELLSFLMESASQSASKAPQTCLMHSPTHAFIFQPQWLPSNLQHSILQMQNFWKQMKVADEEWLVEKLALRLPEKDSALFIHRWRQEGIKGEFARFRKLLLELLGPSKESLLDSFLWESLPLIKPETATQIGHEMGITISLSKTWVTPLDFRENAKASFIVRQGSPFASLDLDEEVASILRKKGLAAPKPILFADTNWSAWFFGLAISPSGAPAVWRFHRTGMSGVPMNAWFRQQCGNEWIILNRPQEYTFP